MEKKEEKKQTINIFKNKVTILSGEAKTGKTFFISNILKNRQKTLYISFDGNINDIIDFNFNTEDNIINISLSNDPQKTISNLFSSLEKIIEIGSVQKFFLENESKKGSITPERKKKLEELRQKEIQPYEAVVFDPFSTMMSNLQDAMIPIDDKKNSFNHWAVYNLEVKSIINKLKDLKEKVAVFLITHCKEVEEIKTKKTYFKPNMREKDLIEIKSITHYDWMLFNDSETNLRELVIGKIGNMAAESRGLLLESIDDKIISGDLTFEKVTSKILMLQKKLKEKFK